MNAYNHKPMPFGAKYRKLYAGQFYLSEAHRTELAELLTNGTLRGERDAIDYIEAHGTWQD